METKFNRSCEILAGLEEVNILDVVGSSSGLTVKVQTSLVVPDCQSCGCRANLKDRDRVSYIDLAFAGRWVTRQVGEFGEFGPETNPLGQHWLNEANKCKAKISNGPT